VVAALELCVTLGLLGWHWCLPWVRPSGLNAPLQLLLLLPAPLLPLLLAGKLCISLTAVGPRYQARLPGWHVPIQVYQHFSDTP
jgi:hypothetical protein